MSSGAFVALTTCLFVAFRGGWLLLLVFRQVDDESEHRDAEQDKANAFQVAVFGKPAGKAIPPTPCIKECVCTLQEAQGHKHPRASPFFRFWFHCISPVCC